MKTVVEVTKRVEAVYIKEDGEGPLYRARVFAMGLLKAFLERRGDGKFICENGDRYLF